MRLLVVNPNTTHSMTDRICAAALSVASAGTEIVAATSRMGPASIEGYYDEAISVPGLLAEIADGERNKADAAIIACFDDTGLDAARTMASIPVVGICEAALSLATVLGTRIVVVTTLDRSRTPIEQLVDRYGMARKTRVRAADIPVLSLEDPTSDALSRLREEIARALAEDRADVVVLGCAGMADLAHRLQAEFGVPVIDGVAAAIKQAEALVSLGLSTSKRGAYATPIAKAYTGLMKTFAPPAPAAE